MFWSPMASCSESFKKTAVFQTWGFGNLCGRTVDTVCMNEYDIDGEVQDW